MVLQPKNLLIILVMIGLLSSPAFAERKAPILMEKQLDELLEREWAKMEKPSKVSIDQEKLQKELHLALEEEIEIDY